MKLTEAERASLEIARQRLGLRSQSDVIRTWIAEFDVVPSDHPSKTHWTAEEAVRIKKTVPAEPTPINMIKPFKSRLKGEWKAP